MVSLPGGSSLALVIDGPDPDVLADFWCAALGYRRVGGIEQYRAIGPPEGTAGLKLLLQGTDDVKVTKNRLHLDIDLAPGVDGRAEVDRLVGLGATEVSAEPHAEFGMRWWVMADPAGNEFCVVEPASP